MTKPEQDSEPTLRDFMNSHKLLLIYVAIVVTIELVILLAGI